MTRTIDETVLTAYALGECTPEETAEVEALLRRSPGAQQLVEQIRALADIAEEALLDEPVLLDDQRQVILDAADAADSDDALGLPPVQAPKPLPPPEAPASEADAKVVPLRRSRRRIWAMRITAMGAVAAVALAAVTVPSFMMLDAPNVSRAPTSSMTTSSASMSESPPDPEVLRKSLLSELQADMREAGVQPELDAATPDMPDRYTVVTPAMKQQLESQGYISDQTADRQRRLQAARQMRRRSVEHDPNSARDRVPSAGPVYNEKPNYRLIQVGGPVADPTPEVSGEQYNPIEHNDFALATDEPLSTFSIDVDTASYANVRRFLNRHTLPPASAVRIEELINTFDYGYTPPVGDAPFATHVEIASCPWNPTHRLARIGIKGQVIEEEELPPSNLVFLLDVSGSMASQNKLPLVQQAIKLLVHELDERDRVAIVVYAGSSGLVLPSTNGEDEGTILRALERLKAGGSTAGGEGIQLAYQTAVGNFIDGGINRVILATDGDFNVGVSDQGELIELIEDRAKSGVFLTVLGFGTGNLQDGTLEQLADHGNGNYAYIDSLDEARKVLVTERGGTMATIAKDVKIQVEFNPMEVHAYRLIGYENRALEARDFADDTKDAGEIGAGHTVTALYEVVPAGTDLAVPSAPILRYQQPTSTTDAAASGELMTVKLRYKRPEEDRSQLVRFAVTDGGTSWQQASVDFRHAAAVAAFGMLLRDSPYAGEATWSMVDDLAQLGSARDPHGYRMEFLRLVRKARALEGE